MPKVYYMVCEDGNCYIYKFENGNWYVLDTVGVWQRTVPVIDIKELIPY